MELRYQFVYGIELQFRTSATNEMCIRDSTYAGSIQQRLKDLQEAMDDEKAKVILCSRGGYGAVHLVGQLDFTPVSYTHLRAHRRPRLKP